MSVNAKKALVLKNRTNYFDRDKDKVRVRVSSPKSYQSVQSKIEGYETRIYWQYKYCESVGGQTFFYTLTYNDKNIPKMYGKNCFDYEDLRDLLRGGFQKQLLRKYGTKFKYFIGAELGDGKGKRGLHNNPHYHILFFLEPDSSDNAFPYQKISPVDFRHLVRLYWQGFDQDDELYQGFRDFRLARKGVAKEGLNCGLVYDFGACMYCAKYVTKDVSLVEHEEEVKKILHMKYKNEYRFKEETYRGFTKSVIYSLYNVPLNAKKTEWLYDDLQLFGQLVPEELERASKVFGSALKIVSDFQPFVVAFCNKYGMWQRFYEYLDTVIEPLIKEGINEWRNRYSNKCRISKGVGEYALKSIVDEMNPTIQVPSKDGFKNRPIGLYYYRKLFCNVMKDERTGNNLYYLNDKGIRYKSMHLQERVEKMVSKCSNYFDLLLQNPSLYDDMYKSDVNTDVTFSFDGFVRQYNVLLSNYSLYDVLNRYAVYKLVYEDRFFSYQVSRSGDVSVFPRIDVRRDYEYFLLPSQYFCTRNDLLLDVFLENTPENYLPYSQHEYFLPFMCLFSVLDLCSDYFFIKGDDKKQRDAEERARVKKFFVKRKLNEYFSTLIK